MWWKKRQRYQPKAFFHLMHARFHHFLDMIRRIDAQGNNRIDAEGNDRITADSKY